jgi:hypothetical protein
MRCRTLHLLLWVRRRPPIVVVVALAQQNQSSGTRVKLNRTILDQWHKHTRLAVGLGHRPAVEKEQVTIRT